MGTHQKTEKPFIGPEQKLPEITFRVFLLGIILTVILAAGNVYLGLKVGTTIATSIPAAIISMAVFRLFKKANVLENNITQTIASIGEASVAGIAFVLPALLIMGYWNYFHFWTTCLITMLGGSLGMLFGIPVRRIMLSNKSLRFPEGTAVGAVLKLSDTAVKSELMPLLYGGIFGAIISLFQTGFRVVSGSFQAWFREGHTIMGFGVGFSPALLAAGYIVGVNVGISLLIGVILGWLLGVPVVTNLYTIPAHISVADAANTLWSQHIRFIAIGIMLFGGLWTVVTLLKQIAKGVYTSFHSFQHGASFKQEKVIRTERDIPFSITFILVGIIAVATFFIAYQELNPHILGISTGMRIGLSLFTILFILIVGFLLASIAAYFAGLIGSTNNPASGLTISALLIFSSLLLGLFEWFNHMQHAKTLYLAAFSIMVGCIMCSIISIACETMQDLKAGQIVGATPWKQQVMLLVGTLVASFTIAPILQLLFHAYGIGGVFPHPGMPTADMLSAPQANLMASVVQGVFAHNLPWNEIGIGFIIAIIAIGVDEFLRYRYSMRLPVLAIGLGMYLPLDSSTPVIIGGLLSYFAHRSLKAKVGKKRFHQDPEVRKRLHQALLIACGLVAGSTIMGVALAIPFALEQSANALRLVGHGFVPFANVLGVLFAAGLCTWIYKVIVK